MEWFPHTKAAIKAADAAIDRAKDEMRAEAELHPHSGQVQVQPQDDAEVFERVLRKALANTRALSRAIAVLSTIAESDNLEGAYAKNSLEEMAALMTPMAPNSRPFSTYDHAGPEY